MIIDSEGTDIDLGVEVLRGVQEGRMSGKETLFQNVSPWIPKSSVVVQGVDVG